MPDSYHHHDDVDEFSDYFDLLWRQKFLILGFVAMAALAGAAWAQYAPKKSRVTVPYSVVNYSVDSRQLCQGSLSCLKEETLKVPLKLLGSDWANHTSGERLTLLTTSPKTEDEYSKLFSDAETSANLFFLRQAEEQVQVIQTELPEAILNTELVALSMLNSKRTIRDLKVNSGSVVHFGPVTIQAASPNTPQIVVWSIFIGGTIGVLFVLLSSSFRNARRDALKAPKISY